MQQHELKKYLKFNVNKKPDKMKKHKNICKRTDREVFKNVIIKEGRPIGY